MTTEQPVRDAFITLNGLRFHYREWGSTSAPPLVLLHGWHEHAHTWDTVAAELADRFRVLALDQRGHGETAWATDLAEYALTYRLADLAAFVDALGLSPFALLGYSSGGAWPAYLYAAHHPDAVTRLVIVDNGPPDHAA